MVTRIVKLTFDEKKVPEFLELFSQINSKISTFPGCLGVQLLKETGKENVFFTYSRWNQEEALENYRKSDFFRQTWTKTKALMTEKAKAWTVEQVSV